MNSLKKKAKCDIIENFDLDNNELTTRTKTNSGYRKTTKSLKDLIQKRISKEEFSKINDKLDYELLNKNSIQEKIKAKEEQILKKREKIKKEEEGIKKLEKEIENLKTLEIKGLINEVDIPYEELVKMIKELKN